jgi:hypothetical protein
VRDTVKIRLNINLVKASSSAPFGLQSKVKFG